MDILDRARQLRALDLDTHRVRKEAIRDILNHASVVGITHLSITTFGSRWRLPPISLPAVQYLRIRANFWSLKGCMTDWEFPSLSGFDLERSRHELTESAFTGLEEFVAAHGRKITNLNINFIKMADDVILGYPIDEVFWGWFPNLRIFGPGLGALHDGIIPPSPGVSITSLAIPHTSHQLPYARPNFEAYVDSLLRACHTLHVKGIVILASWNVMASGYTMTTPEGIHYLNSSGWTMRLFVEAAAKGIDIVDVDRVSITSPQGVRFLEKLRGPTSVG